MKPSPFTPEFKTAIIKTILFVCEKFSVSKRVIYSDSREKEAVEPRFVAFYILNKFYDFSLDTIANEFERDPSTVANGLKQIENWGWDEEVLRQVNERFPKKGYPQAYPQDIPTTIPNENPQP